MRSGYQADGAPNTESRKRYLEMLTHDIRSALGGAIGALEQIDPDALDDKSRRFYEGALTSALAAGRLFDGALDLEAIENNDFALAKEPTNLDAFLTETQRRWSAAAAARGIGLEVRRSTALPTEIEADRVRLSRVIGNIVDNAIKYTEKGTVQVLAEVNGKGNLNISVADNGPGFSPDALDRLFEFRGRPKNASRPGTGLGLHIAHLIVSQMGGKVRVNQAALGGAVVTVCLPGNLFLDDPATEAARPGDSPTIANADLPDLSHLNILLAEDNATNQIVVTEMLEAMGARFSVASDGVEALQLFETGVFDLALLDIEMPRLSGLEVIRAIRSRNDDRARIPIVALTAFAMRDHQEKISNAGADGLIAKPILGIENLGEALLTYMRRRARPMPVSLGAKEGEARTNDAAEILIDDAVFGALERSIGSAKMSELLGKVSTDLADVRDGLAQGIRTKSSTDVRSSSHVLISVAGAIGAISTQQAAEWLNRAANAEDWSQVRTTGEVCLTRIGQLLNVVETKLNS